MVERKTPVKTRTAQVPAEPANPPIGRFYDLQQEVSPPKPYVLTEDITIPPLTRGQYIAIQNAADEEAAGRVMLGEHYEAIEALFADRPLAEWTAFTVEINRHLFGAGTEEAPGKSEESSSS